MEQLNHRYITVAYDLYADNSAGIHEILEQAPVEHPFQFITNLGMALESFESKVAHLNEGDEFDFTLSVDEGYGPYEEKHVIEVPKTAFFVDGRFDKEQIFPGNIIPLVNEDGYRFDGLVNDVKEDVVVLDLNPLYAGKELHYKGRVVTARPATEEEVKGAINILTGGGGCGCGSCGCGEGDHGHAHDHDGCGCGCGDDDDHGGGCCGGGCGCH